MPQEGDTKFATMLSKYYENLTSKRVPDELAAQIVLDAAKRLHNNDLVVGGLPR